MTQENPKAIEMVDPGGDKSELRGDVAAIREGFFGGSLRESSRCDDSRITVRLQQEGGSRSRRPRCPAANLGRGGEGRACADLATAVGLLLWGG